MSAKKFAITQLEGNERRGGGDPDRDRGVARREINGGASDAFDFRGEALNHCVVPPPPPPPPLFPFLGRARATHETSMDIVMGTNRFPRVRGK